MKFIIQVNLLGISSAVNVLQYLYGGCKYNLFTCLKASDNVVVKIWCNPNMVNTTHVTLPLADEVYTVC